MDLRETVNHGPAGGLHLVVAEANKAPNTRLI